MTDTAPTPPATVADAEDAAELSHGAPKWVPTILLHVFYPDSRKVGFGWWLFILASAAAFFLKNGTAPMLDASTWLICTAFSSALIGGGSIADAKHDLEMAKLSAAPAVPAAV